MKKYLYLFVFLGLCVILFFMFQPKENISVMYSWNMSALEDSSFLTNLKKLNVKTLYQDFKTDYLEKNDNKFLETLNKNKIEVYNLCGEPSWGYQKNIEVVTKEIEKIKNYNSNNAYQITGMLYDIETYQNEDFDFEEFLSTMEEIKEITKEANLKVGLAIPYWFDTEYGVEALTTLLKDIDVVSVMNYNISKTKENIQNELEIAKNLNIEINTIYEIDFDSPDKFDSLESIQKDFKKIQENYPKLQIAYHYYDKIKDCL